MDTFSNLVIVYLLVYEDGTECSEKSAYKIQTPGNYPVENIKQSLYMPITGTQGSRRLRLLFFSMIGTRR
jgi:hypothetical protein